MAVFAPSLPAARSSRHVTFGRRAAAALCALALAGCALGPDFVAPTSAPPATGLRPRDPASAPLVSHAQVPLEWWTLFDDPLLSELQVRATAGNLDLQSASERIAASRAVLGIVSAERMPRVDAGGSYAREGISANGKFAALGAPLRPGDFWQVAFDASWEIDLWGRVRRNQEQASALLEATAYDAEAARVTLAAEVARTYLQLRGTQAQLGIARENLAVAQRLLGLTRTRERLGVATRFETSSARAQEEAVRASIPELLRQRNALMNALALLLGEEPRALDGRLRDAMPLPVPPRSVPVGLESELARRRPDIRSAEARLHAAVAGIGAARADFYPRLGLRARVGLEAFDSGDLLSWDSRFFSVGPTVYLPIFQGGRLVQRLALSEARQRAAALAYRQTVLRAWHEVDNALDALASAQQQHVALVASHEQGSEALHAAERRYQEGAADYLSVLAAQRVLLGSQGALNASATGTTLAMVNLYNALGGGWDPRAPDASRLVDASGKARR
jgi:NodT family efflux transporter outer membrane factor (OMF) lipoprotein